MERKKKILSVVLLSAILTLFFSPIALAQFFRVADRSVYHDSLTSAASTTILSATSTRVITGIASAGAGSGSVQVFCGNQRIFNQTQASSDRHSFVPMQLECSEDVHAITSVGDGVTVTFSDSAPAEPIIDVSIGTTTIEATVQGITDQQFLELGNAFALAVGSAVFFGVAFLFLYVFRGR